MKSKKSVKASPRVGDGKGVHSTRPEHVRRDRRQRAKKGPWTGGPPFGREFFAETLPGMVQGCPCTAGHAPMVAVHLGDGSILDVAGIVTLFERYAVVAAFEGKGADGVERTKDDIGFEAFPYDLVVRTSVRIAPATNSQFGFGAFKNQPITPPPPPVPPALPDSGRGA